MDIKLMLTGQFLYELGRYPSKKTVKKCLHLWWKNARLNGNRSLGLTEQGYDVIKNQIGLKFYQIDFPNSIVFTNQLVIQLDKFIDCPYYITDNSIMVSREKTAVQLILFSGDLYRFIKSKENFQKIC